MRFSEYAFIDEQSPVKQPSKSSNQSKRRVIDDEEEEFDDSVIQSQSNDDDESGGWLNKRDPNLMSRSEKQYNSNMAKSERRQQRNPYSYNNKVIDLSDTPDSKSFIVDEDDDDDEEEKEIYKSRRSKLNKGNTKSSNKSKVKNNKNAKKVRTKKGNDGVIELDESEEEESEFSDDSEDSDESEEELSVDSDSSENNDEDENDEQDDGEDDNHYDDDELGNKQLKDMAKKIMSKCDSTIQNLQTALRQWAGNSQQKENSESNEHCVDLLKIESDSKEIIHEKYLKSICPNLELKAYQIVGINWMKLLHQNNVNGILADDMVNCINIKKKIINSLFNI